MFFSSFFFLNGHLTFAGAAVEGTSWELSQLRDQLFHEMSDHVVNRAKLLKRRAAEKVNLIEYTC